MCAACQAARFLEMTGTMAQSCLLSVCLRLELGMMLLHNCLRLPASGAGLFPSDRWWLTSCSHVVSVPKYLISKVVKSSVTICLGSCNRRSTASQHKVAICLFLAKGKWDGPLRRCSRTLRLKQKLQVFAGLLSDALFYFYHSHQLNSLWGSMCAKSSCAIFTLQTFRRSMYSGENCD